MWRLRGTFWWMRTGASGKRKVVTQQGLADCQAMAARFVAGRRGSAPIVLDAAFCSDLPRSKICARHVLTALGQSITVVPYPAFFVNDLVTGESGEAGDAVEREIGHIGTAERWLQRWPAAHTMRERIQDGMLELALEQEDREREFHIMVMHHSPGCQLAAPDVLRMGPIRPADVVRYRIYETPKGLVIASAHHIPYKRRVVL